MRYKAAPVLAVLVSVMASFAAVAAQAAPFSGSPWPMPGRVQVEDYDTGGEGNAYHDTTSGNAGSTYRADDVDIWNDGTAEGNYTGAMATGEWLQYTVNVAAAGDYLLTLRVSTPNNGRALHVEFNGSDVTGSIPIPNTGGWVTWQNVSVPVTLTSGQQVMRLVVDNGGLNASSIDLQSSGASTVAAPTISPNGGTYIGSVDVSLSTTTGGAEIHYTTNGSTPTASSPLYTGAFTLNANATVKAIGILSGDNDSPVSSASFTISSGSGQEPFGGSPRAVPGQIETEDYDTGGEGVAYHDSTAGNAGATYRSDDVDIWNDGGSEGNYVGAMPSGEYLEYTVDVASSGDYLLSLRLSTPNNGRIVHVEFGSVDVTGAIAVPNTGGWVSWQNVSVPVTLAAGQQIMRLAVDKGGLNVSSVNIQSAGTSTVATPTITPNGGTFTGSVDVTLSTTTSGAAIHYTTDGSTPTVGSPLYTGTFTLNANATVKAIGIRSGYNDSAVASAVFTMTAGGQQPFGGTPWSLPGAVEAEDYDVGGEGVAYHDTTTGNAGATYRSDDVDIWNDGGSEGNYVGAMASSEYLEYTVNVPSTGQYTLQLRLSTPNSNRRVHVEFGGVDVTGTVTVPNTGGWTSWQDVSVPVSLTAGQQVMRLVVDNGGMNLSRISVQSTATPTVATPMISPNGGTFSGSVDVTLSTTTSGAAIHYTTDGSTPTAGSPLYTGAFTLNANATVKAIGILSGYNDSAVASAAFTVSGGTPTVATPTITPNGGTFTGSVDVTLSTTTSSAAIHYTTDGSTPTAGSPLYTGAFTLNANATVKAIGILSGYNDSAVASAAFTVTADGQQPFGGTPWSLPGAVEAEDYDVGGEGVAYHDTTTGNLGATYRSDDVDIWNDGGSEGNYVGAMASSEYLEYTVNVPSTGQYTLQLRLSTPNSNRRVHVEFGGVDVTGTVTVPNTGGWTSWQNVSVPVSLTAGQQVMRLVVDNGGMNLSRITVQDFTLNVADDFNDGNANGWLVVDDSGTTSNWSVSGGKYRQNNFVGNFGAALVNGYHLGTYSYLQSSAGLSGYQFSVDVTPLANTGEEVGVLFYYQNNNNYYRFVTSLSDGFSRLERRVGGTFRTLAQNARGYDPGTVLSIVVNIEGGVIQVSVNGQKLMSAYDTSLSSGAVGLYARDGVSFDNVAVVPATSAPTIALSKPTDLSVTPGSSLSVEATVLNAPAGAAVAFDLDGNPSSCTTASQPSPGRFTASCSAAAGVHVLTAELRDQSSTLLDTDSHDSAASGGNVYVTIGDSNTWGEGDKYGGDGNTVGGWRKALHGYQTNLVDDLNAATPVINIAFNESVRGDTLNSVLTSRLSSYLERDAGANHAIVMLGTNDANGSSPVASGINCSGTACNGTFKGRLASLVNSLNNAGMTPIVVQVPPRWADGIAAPAYSDPLGQPVNSIVISEYNQVVRGEDSNPLSGYVVGPNLFQYYLTSTTNRFPLFYDALHLSGLAHEILAAQIRNVITGGSQLPFIVDNLCVRTSTGGACRVPTLYKQDLMGVGDAPYIDAGNVITGSLPSQLSGGRWIRTANADRSLSNNDYLSFTLPKSSTVYVAFDSDATPPSWLTAAGFADSHMSVQTNTPGAGTLELYSKSFAAGTVTLGGANAATTRADANFVVIVK